MNDLVVDRGAKHRRISVIAKKGRLDAEFLYFGNGRTLKIHRRSTCPHHGFDRLMHLAKGYAGDAHLFDFLLGLDQDRHYLTFSCCTDSSESVALRNSNNVARMDRVTSSMERFPSTSAKRPPCER